MWGPTTQSSGLRAGPALQSLLHTALTLFHACLALGPQLLGLRLLLGREDREQVSAKPRLLHRQVGFHGCEVLHGRANASLVNRHRVDGLLLCGARRPEALHQRPRLLLMLLRDVPRLLALRLGEIQRRERETHARAAGATSAGTGRTLRERGSTRNQEHERGKDGVSE